MDCMSCIVGNFHFIYIFSFSMTLAWINVASMAYSFRFCNWRITY